jgi:mitosis inhibitor protein kinase SWE1
LVEIALGIRYIHAQGFLHLDIKPANIFISFEGCLKIGDFGMATTYPAAPGIEREGDREYIAPEVLSRQRYDKPADIFSLGIMMLEIAANIVLPDNGVHWQKLRSGDLSDAGRLSSSDLSGVNGDDDDELLGMDQEMRSPTVPPAAISYSTSVGSRAVPPWAAKFMVDNSGALDRMVERMLSPDPTKRPTAAQVLETEECQWVETHRKAGAVIYEGDYGPEPDPIGVNEGLANDMLRDDHDWRRNL